MSGMTDLLRRLVDLVALIPMDLAWPVGQPPGGGAPVPARYAEQVDAGRRMGEGEDFRNMDCVACPVDQEEAAEHVEPAVVAVDRRLDRRRHLQAAADHVDAAVIVPDQAAGVIERAG